MSGTARFAVRFGPTLVCALLSAGVTIVVGGLFLSSRRRQHASPEQVRSVPALVRPRHGMGPPSRARCGDCRCHRRRPAHTQAGWPPSRPRASTVARPRTVSPWPWRLTRPAPWRIGGPRFCHAASRRYSGATAATRPLCCPSWCSPPQLWAIVSQPPLLLKARVGAVWPWRSADAGWR